MPPNDGVSESERLWKSIDDNTKTIKGLCEQVTKIDTFITLSQQNKNRNYALLGGVIAAIVTGINLLFNLAE